MLALPAKRTPQQQNALYDYYLATRDDEYVAARQGASAKLEAERDAIKERSPVTHIQEE